MSTTAIGRQSPLSGIVITGASSDIGRVLTDHFARKRIPLILTTRSDSVKLREESKNTHVLSSIDLAHRDALETLAKGSAPSSGVTQEVL
jgi:short-subunit dehydrogenase